jgi:hypothetical protein
MLVLFSIVPERKPPAGFRVGIEDLGDVLALQNQQGVPFL